MILVRLNGGLGNQMFQYAAGRSLSIKQSTRLLLDTRTLTNHKSKRDNSVIRFNISATIASNDEMKYWPTWSRYILRKADSMGFKSHWHFEKEFTYSNINIGRHHSSLIEGYFQSEKYFSDIRGILINEFTPKHGIDETTAASIKKIKDCESVMIHVRRGDYATDIHAKKTHGICTKSYYDNALTHLKKRLNNIKLFIFSDDPEWAKFNIFEDINAEYITGNLTHPEIDMHLMSACKHHIIANSTFSWWGAWLADHDDKQVIYPTPWFDRKTIDTRDLIPQGWHPVSK